MDKEGEILKQAASLWAHRGFATVGIQEICEASGITKPTLYHYFGSKLGLLEAVLEEGFGLLSSSLEAERAYKCDVLMALKSWSDVYLQFAAKHKDFFRLVLGLTYAYPDSEEGKTVAPFIGRIYGSLKKLFDASSKDHGIMKSREHLYAVSFLGLMNTHAAMIINLQEKWTEEVSKKTLHQFIHGIFS